MLNNNNHKKDGKTVIMLKEKIKHKNDIIHGKGTERKQNAKGQNIALPTLINPTT